MHWRVLTTREFDAAFEKLDRSIRPQIEKEIAQLESNPLVGKPLGYRFFREKKAGKHRMYYLIYEELVIVFVVGLSDKKGQQKAIAAIRQMIPFYREEVRNRFTL
ncbi:MAG: type II toxin-antitoxin system RelE/ParE family toxin [Candidatus Diapherotrites archaeon]|nr:type II toxin-antitoxin system RelE/ParE family toxin [Candidatus Diapherotrites archaeon]